MANKAAVGREMDAQISAAMNEAELQSTIAAGAIAVCIEDREVPCVPGQEGCGTCPNNNMVLSKGRHVVREF